MTFSDDVRALDEAIVRKALAELRREDAERTEYAPPRHYTEDTIAARIERVCQDAVEAYRWTTLRQRVMEERK